MKRDPNDLHLRDKSDPNRCLPKCPVCAISKGEKMREVIRRFLYQRPWSKDLIDEAKELIGQG